eukprot:GGOE01014699.1.p1 GENE.GGOE01014699.1~~GGOE01014699.1.p1  ORF type:complete len:933 (+),score=181.55 GGOE01014699.1:146-2800(+)
MDDKKLARTPSSSRAEEGYTFTRQHAASMEITSGNESPERISTFRGRLHLAREKSAFNSSDEAITFHPPSSSQSSSPISPLTSPPLLTGGMRSPKVQDQDQKAGNWSRRRMQRLHEHSKALNDAEDEDLELDTNELLEHQTQQLAALHRKLQQQQAEFAGQQQVIARAVQAEIVHFWAGVVDRWTERAKTMMQTAAEKEIAEAETLAEALSNVGLCVAVPDILSGTISFRKTPPVQPKRPPPIQPIQPVGPKSPDTAAEPQEEGLRERKILFADECNKQMVRSSSPADGSDDGQEEAPAAKGRDAQGTKDSKPDGNDGLEDINAMRVTSEYTDVREEGEHQSPAGSPAQSPGAITPARRSTRVAKMPASRRRFSSVAGITGEDGKPMHRTMSSVPEQKIRYQKGAQVGSGGFGTVFVGLNDDTGELLAIKNIPFDPKDKQVNVKLKELQREIQVMKSLDHPNIVRYFQTAREGSSINIFMEYVPGGSIANLLKQFGPLKENVVKSYTSQILEGLMYLHERNVVHRDIKGANILIGVDGQCKLADFGAAGILDGIAHTGLKSLKGTPYWMAPEVITQSGHAWPADIWSLGCTVMEMLTANPPFQHVSRSQLSVMQFIVDDKIEITCPEGLTLAAQNFLLRMLIRDASLRASAEALTEDPFLMDDESDPEASAADSVASKRDFSPARNERPSTAPPARRLSQSPPSGALRDVRPEAKAEPVPTERPKTAPSAPPRGEDINDGNRSADRGEKDKDQPEAGEANAPNPWQLDAGGGGPQEDGRGAAQGDAEKGNNGDKGRDDDGRLGRGASPLEGVLDNGRVRKRRAPVLPIPEDTADGQEPRSPALRLSYKLHPGSKPIRRSSDCRVIPRDQREMPPMPGQPEEVPQ